MYVKITNNAVDQYPYTVGNLRSDNPNTSFPKKVPTATLEAWGVHSVVVVDEPSYDAMTHKVVSADSPTLVGGSWTITKTVVALTAEEIQANSDAEAMVVRMKRDDLIEKTDFYALSDVVMTDEMAAYRQALRDISSHASFPYLQDSDWPVKP